MAASPRDAGPACYAKQNNKVSQFNGVPCSKNGDGARFTQCCWPGDTCLGNSLCYFKHTLAGGSGFYVGGCTDSRYLAPSCSLECSSLPVTDVVWNPQNNLWACCNQTNGVRDCGDPSDQTFQADPPQSLLAAVSASTNGQSATVTPTAFSVTVTATPSVPVSAAASVSPSSSVPADPITANSGLTTGQVAGVAVGSALGGILLLSTLIFGLVFFYRRRQRRRQIRKSAAIVKPLNQNEMDRLMPMYGAEEHSASKPFSPHSFSDRNRYSSQPPDDRTPSASGTTLRPPGPKEATGEVESSPPSRQSMLPSEQTEPVELDAAERD